MNSELKYIKLIDVCFICFEKVELVEHSIEDENKIINLCDNCYRCVLSAGFLSLNDIKKLRKILKSNVLMLSEFQSKVA